MRVPHRQVLPELDPKILPWIKGEGMESKKAAKTRGLSGCLADKALGHAGVYPAAGFGHPGDVGADF